MNKTEKELATAVGFNVLAMLGLKWVIIFAIGRALRKAAEQK